MALRLIELLLGWLAVILVGAVVAYIYFGGFIAPDSVQVDLTASGVILLALAVGVTTDSLIDFLPGKILLVLTTLVYTGIAVTSFIIFLLLPAILLGGATALAFIRPYLAAHPQA